MKETRPETTIPEDTIEETTNTDISSEGRSAIQGNSDGDWKDTKRVDIAASEFSEETKQQLEANGVGNMDGVLADDGGKQAEKLTQVVLKNEGIPLQGGKRQDLTDIVPGQYDAAGHGIDLVGVADDGSPIILEVKKRQNPKRDSLGDSDVSSDKYEPETHALIADIERERDVNPSKRYSYEHRNTDEPDRELSNMQMGDLWVRDRWLKLAKDPENKARLIDAGVNSEYLDLDNLKAADTQQWGDILNNRTTVIVSTDKEDVTRTLMKEAAFSRGFHVVGINLKS